MRESLNVVNLLIMFGEKTYRILCFIESDNHIAWKWALLPFYI